MSSDSREEAIYDKRYELRWFLSIALRIPAAHDFRVKCAYTYSTKEIFLKLSSIAK